MRARVRGKESWSVLGNGERGKEKADVQLAAICKNLLAGNQHQQINFSAFPNPW